MASSEGQKAGTCKWRKLSMKAKRVNKEREGEEEAWINNHPPRSTIIHQDQQPSTKMWKAACFPEVMCGSARFPPRRTRQGARSNPFPGGSLSFSFLGRLTNELGECRITRKPWSLRRLTRETLIKAKVLGWGTGALDWSGACVIIGLILYGGGRRPPRARNIFYFHC